MKILRTRQYLGILTFFYFAVITYNLLSLFRYYILKGTPLESMAILDLTKKLMDIPAKIVSNERQLSLAFPKNHALCEKYFQSNKRFWSVL